MKRERERERERFACRSMLLCFLPICVAYVPGLHNFLSLRGLYVFYSLSPFLWIFPFNHLQSFRLFLCRNEDFLRTHSWQGKDASWRIFWFLTYLLWCQKLAREAFFERVKAKSSKLTIFCTIDCKFTICPFFMVIILFAINVLTILFFLPS